VARPNGFLALILMTEFGLASIRDHAEIQSLCSHIVDVAQCLRGDNVRDDDASGRPSQERGFEVLIS
jgi:hypothetical protein